MNIEELAKYLKGEILFGKGKKEENYSEKVSINTKTMEKGDVFIALSGGQKNGHAFVEDAQKKGASALIVEEAIETVAIPVIKVKNTIHALLALAHHKRSQYKGITIAITGSAGKTTVKELLSHVLSQKYTIDKNFVNYNNQIGMSLSILSASLESDIWIMEVGISKAHDMSELGECLVPDIALIINSGSAHESGLGEKGVAYHKASLIQYLSKKKILFSNTTIESCAFVCSSYKKLVEEAKKIKSDSPIYFYSSSEKAITFEDTVECIYIGKKENKGLYKVKYKEKEEDLLLPYVGSFMSENIIVIISISLYLGLNFEEIILFLSSSPKVEQRNNLVQIKEHIIIDDSYNANPVSMRVMVDTVAEYKEEYSVVMVLGDMNELGEKSEEEHEQLGEYIATQFKNTPICIFWKGVFAENILKGLTEKDFKGIFIAILSKEEFLINIEKNLLNQTVFLFKGSRSNQLEKYVQFLYAHLGEKNVI